jgi:FtsP/CotA-like multicopper oxidase with cupredoxin domain
MKLSGKIFAIVGMLVSVQQAVAMGGSQTISPRDAVDLNPDPNVVEVVLVAHENVVDFGTGNKTAVWTYNGGIPGPTIKGKVGDRLVVHFWNYLPEETTVHWHGLELPADQDGSHISQLAVESYGYKRYEFDLNRASLFWYHPHVRSDDQIEKGLYGALLVEDPAENAELGLPKGRKQHVLVLDDVLLDDNGHIAEHFSKITDPLARAKHILDGREGNLKTVSGKHQPTVKVQKGEPQRLRVVNTSNSTFMRLSLSGHSGHTMYRIGGDGGLLEAPLKIHPIGCDDGGGHGGHMAMEGDGDTCVSNQGIDKGVLLTPGERADIVFTPMGNDPIQLEWHDLRRGRHNAFYKDDGTIGLQHQHTDGQLPKETLMTFFPSRRGGDVAYVPPASLKDLDELVPDVAAPLVLKFGHSMPDANGDIKLFVQDLMKPFPMVTPDDAYDLEVGKTYIWETWNMTGGIHNFHPHGFSVQLIETVYVDMDKPEGEKMVVVPAPYTEWKDTVAMPARPGAPMRSRTVQRYAMKIDDTGREGRVAASGKIPTEDASGGWLLHCHINEHSRNGMGTFFEVFEPAE